MIYTMSYAAFTCALVLSSYSIEYSFVALIVGSILGMASQSGEDPSIHGLIPSIISVVAITYSYHVNDQLNVYLYTAIVLSTAAILGHIAAMVRVIDFTELKTKFKVPKIKKGVKNSEK